MSRTIPPNPDSVTPRSFVAWDDYLVEPPDMDGRAGAAWSTPEEAEEALAAEYGQVPMAEFFDFGAAKPYEERPPDEGDASVLRVLR